MKLLFDHDVPDDTAYGLRAQGHEVFKLRDLIDLRTKDEDVLRPVRGRKQLRVDYL